MNTFIKIPVLFAALFVVSTACVAKRRFLESQDALTQTQMDLIYTQNELDRAKSSLVELQGLKPELAAKEAALENAQKQLEEAKARLTEMDTAKRQMEESLKSEIDQKTIKIERLRDRLTVTFIDKILFDSGSAVIKEIGKSSLQKVAESLQTLPNHSVHVEGHTDDQAIVSAALRKTFPTNWELSTARATSVVRFLQDVGHLDPTRLHAVGRSFYQPVATNDTPEGRSENRRVEIVLIPVLKEGIEASQ